MGVIQLRRSMGAYGGELGALSRTQDKLSGQMNVLTTQLLGVKTW